VGDQRTDTAVATVHARSEPLDVAADPQAKTICVTGNGDNTVAVLAACRGRPAARCR